MHCATYSAASGQYLLTGGADRKVHLWNPTTKTRIQTYAAHGYEVLSIAVAPDNASFVSAGGDKLVFLWDVTTAATTRRFEGHYARINTVSFAGDGGDAVIVSGSYDATVRFWDVRSQNRKPIQTLNDAKDAVTDVCVRDAEVAAASVDGRVRVYDLRMGRCLVDVIGAPVTSVRQSADGGALLVASLDSTVRLMDKTNGGLLQAYKGHHNTEYRTKCAFAGAEEWVFAGDEEGMVWVWDLVGGGVREKVRHGGKVVTSVAWQPGMPGGRMPGQWVSTGTDGRVIVWGEHT